MRGRRSLSNSPIPIPEGAAVSDDDANADLSIAILAKAKDRAVHASPFVNHIMLDSDDEDTSAHLVPLEDGLVYNSGATVSEDLPSRKPKSCKKGKSRKKKKLKDAQNTRNDDTNPITEESKKVDGDVLFKIIADDGEDNLEMRKLLRGPRYFDLEQKTDICFRCGNSGHIAAKCREEIHKKACYVCGSLEHEVIDCPQGSCFICRGSGHFAKTCPKKGNRTPRILEGSKICMRCGEAGHEMSLCNRDYHPEDLKVIKCYVCKNYGHLCCVDVALTSEKTDSCYNCGELGHTGVGCAKAHNENSRGVGKVCYKCGEEGHFARGCSKREEDDLWATSTRIESNQIESEFQGFRSVPAMAENSSRRTRAISTKEWFKDRWDMNAHERGNKFEGRNSSYRSRENQFSPHDRSRWELHEYERENKYEGHSSRYGKRQKRLSTYQDTDKHSKSGSSSLKKWQKKHRSEKLRL